MDGTDYTDYRTWRQLATSLPDDGTTGQRDGETRRRRTTGTADTEDAAPTELGNHFRLCGYNDAAPMALAVAWPISRSFCIQIDVQKGIIPRTQP